MEDHLYVQEIISYLHTEGTEIWNIRHKNPFFSLQKCYDAIASISVKNDDFFKNFFFAKKFKIFPFQRTVPIFLTPRGYFSKLALNLSQI